MAFNGMSSVPAVSQRTLAITATQFSSFATPAITVPFPSVYAGQTQIPFTFTNTASWPATRVPTTLGGVAATAGVHSINAQASAAGYRTHNYGNNGGGSHWPVWATAVIAACGGAAVILTVLGLYCWRRKRKQKTARKRAAMAAGAYGGYDEGKKRRRGTRHGGAYKEKPAALQDPKRRSRAGAAAGVAGRTRSNHMSVSPNRSRKRGTPYDYPPPPITGMPDSPSHVRSRDLAALGINRPTSASPSVHRQREAELAAHPNAFPADAPAFPQFAVPRDRRSREFSGGSQNGRLPPAAPFAYQEGGRPGYETPPPRAPNTLYGEYDSPGQNGSPARLLASTNGYSLVDQDTPRSSMTMSTHGTGGVPYRWDHDADQSVHMADAGAVSAALGRAMLGDSTGPDGVGGAYGSADDGHWGHGPYASSAHGHGGSAQGYDRSTTPTYPPAVSTATTSRAPSRQRDNDLARASTYAPSHDGHHLQALGGGHPRSMTPLGEPILGDTGGHGAWAAHGRSGSAASMSGASRNYSRASNYETAAESGSDDGYDAAPQRPYAR